MKFDLGTRKQLAGAIAALLVTPMMSGCVTVVNPKDMRVPSQITCIDLPSDLSTTEPQGILGSAWTTRLERGPYIAEREDDEGTYFRAPQGGLLVAQEGMMEKPAGLMTHMTFDGGIFIPRDTNALPHLYRYYTIEPAPVAVPPAEANCLTTTFVCDPFSKGVSTLAYAEGGAASGATAGLVTRALASNSRMSYGQAGLAGAAGGAIAGVIIAQLIQMDAGKIVQIPVSKNRQFTAQLSAIARGTVPIKEATMASETK